MSATTARGRVGRDNGTPPASVGPAAAVTVAAELQALIDGAAPVGRDGGGLGAGSALRRGAAAGDAAAVAGAGLEEALRLRAPHVHASTPLVRRLVARICRCLGLGATELMLADRAAQLRDVGMIGLPDSVIASRAALEPEQWESLARHPVLGAQLLASLPGLQDVAVMVRGHHERWDGAGYPDGLQGDAIPLLSRVIAVADAVIAITRDRPHRKAAGVDVALEHIAHERGTQFDPRAVDAMFEVLGRRPPSLLPPVQDTPVVAPARTQPATRHERGARLVRGLATLDALPAFTPACQRAMQAARARSATSTSELISAIESDTSLTVAILRHAQAHADGAVVADIPTAVAAMGMPQAEQIIAAVPRIEFPWQTAADALLYELRIHGQLVARAAERLAQESTIDADRDQLITAALLHDIGKLLLSRTYGHDLASSDPRRATPEQRVHDERRQLNLDHASLGGLLVQRWKLPGLLSDTIAAHHRADAPNEMATLLRLADLVARQVRGDRVDRRMMLALASACELSQAALGDVLFDLPQSGSRRRRTAPSPLTTRETEALRGLAAGKVYQQIADELGLSTSTIRSHLQKVYTKLGVDDRAHAVLTATEMGWI